MGDKGASEQHENIMQSTWKIATVNLHSGNFEDMQRERKSNWEGEIEYNCCDNRRHLSITIRKYIHIIKSNTALCRLSLLGIFPVTFPFLAAGPNR